MFVQYNCNWIKLYVNFLAHAVTVFKNMLWLTGGRSDLYAMYNMGFTYKNADVWQSADGGMLYFLLL